jgi:hypothetical protein
LRHALAPAVIEYVPAVQFMHALALIAPVVPEYAPTGQFSHALVSDRKYLPTEQPTHEAVTHPFTCTSARIK